MQKGRTIITPHKGEENLKRDLKKANIYLNASQKYTELTMFQLYNSGIRAMIFNVQSIIPVMKMVPPGYYNFYIHNNWNISLSKRLKSTIQIGENNNVHTKTPTLSSKDLSTNIIT